MDIHLKKAGIELAIVLALLWVPPLLTAAQEDLLSAQSQKYRAEQTSPFALARHEEGEEKVSPKEEDPRTMTEGEWEALAQKVGTNLEWIGIQMGVQPEVRAIYVPALTQEYLQAFQLSLLQGATKQQADILASQYIFARIRQLAAQSSSAPGGQAEEGWVYSPGGSFCEVSDGIRSYTFR